MSPREFAAHRRLFETAQRQHAEDLADLKAHLFVAGGVKIRDNPDHQWTAEDFLPEQYRRPRPVKTWQEQLAVFQEFTASRAKKTG